MEKTGTLPNADLAARASTRLKALGLLALLGLIWLLRPIVVIRFGKLIAARIGHLALNTECYLCEKDLGLNRPRRVFDIWTPGPAANQQLFSMFARRIFVWESRIPEVLDFAAQYLDWWHEHQFSDANWGRDIYNLFERVPQHIGFTEREGWRGEEGLRELGIPPGAKFVCLQVRDSEYLKNFGNYAYHDFRDADVQGYAKVALWLARRGYYVVRMGQKVREAFKVKHPKIIDYATNGKRTDFMDIYLGAKCEFCLTNGSGFDSVPAIFRRPLCFVNFAPVEYLSTFAVGSVGIWKHHYRNGKEMTLDEILSSGAGRFLKTEQFAEAGITLTDNTPDEICDAVLEMVGRLEKRFPEDERSTVEQSGFWKRFPRSTSPHTGRPLHGEIRMKIGRKFLRELT